LPSTGTLDQASQDYADSFSFAERGSLSRPAGTLAAQHDPGLGIIRRLRSRDGTKPAWVCRARNNAAVAALIAAATAGKALVDDDCAKKAAAERTRD
jgi:hypothetical protein